MFATGTGSPLPAGEPEVVQRAEGDAEAIQARLGEMGESGDPSPASGPDADRQLQRRCAWPPCFSRGMAPIPEGLFPGLALGAMPEATTRLHTAIAAHDAEGILAATVLWQRIQAAIPPSAAEWPWVMVILCVALQGKFEVTGEIADLDDAIDAGRRGIAAVPGGAPALGMQLANLATALRMRFNHSGWRGRHYIDEAIAIYRQAIMTTPEGNPKRAGVLSGLCAALHARSMAFQDEADPAEAILVERDALTELLELVPRLS
jgi:hypothetical protein